MTYPVKNSSDRSSHTEVAISQPGVIQYTCSVLEKAVIVELIL